jgi:hypothetical protein
VVVVTVVCIGPAAEATRLVQPLREAAPMIADGIAVQPYVDLHRHYAGFYPAGRHTEVTSHYLPGLADVTIGEICDRFREMPGGSCEIRLDHMGGAVGRVAPMATAVPNRDAPFVLSAMARWGEGDTGAGALCDWLRHTAAALGPHAVGGPHIGMDTGTVSAVQAYGGDRYLRLSALKQRLDPDNVFARNLNVAPLS